MRRLACLLVMVAACGDSGGQGTPDAAVPQPDAFIRTCDVLRTDECTMSTAAPKCGVTVALGTLTTRCVAQAGSLGAGAVCTRGATAGVDDCDKTFWCSGIGVPVTDDGVPVMRYCRSFCTDESRCSQGETCMQFLSSPKVGYCLPSGCNFYSTSCPANTTCDALLRYDGTTYFGVCRANGGAAVGASCDQDDCVAGARCTTESPGKFVCHAHCDDMHPCPGAAACSPLAGMPLNGGICP